MTSPPAPPVAAHVGMGLHVERQHADNRMNMSNTAFISSLLNFCERNSSCKSLFSPFLEQKELSSSQRNKILEILQDLLKDPRFTKDIAECFSNILLILLTSAIKLNVEKVSNSEEANLLHRINCSILGKLVHEHPDVLRFTLRYFELYPAPFSTVGKNATSEAQPLERMEVDSAEISDYDIVLASFNILKAKPDHFKRKWKWSEFYPFLTHFDDKVKWIAWMCLGIILDMPEPQRLKYARSVINSEVLDKFLIESEKQGLNITISASETTFQEESLIVEKTKSVVSVAGVLLPILNNTWNKLQSSLVPVPSLEENLRSLALAVATGKCVCVQGTVGCGKTSIIEYLAKITGRGPSDFIRVQLGDQTDSKIMLGTYRCTEIPGEFVWQPGILTRAVVTGKWLLLEDIDSATLDVASTLSSLLETGTLSVPGHRDLIHAKSGFQMFVTQRLFSSTTGFRKPVSTASNMLAKHWSCVNMEPFSKGELVQIIETLFPKLSKVASKMVEVFSIFKSDEETDLDIKSSISRSGRLISTRDLIKWCSRAVNYYVAQMSDNVKEYLFNDAIDIFCCAVADEEKRRPLIIAVGHKLGINKVRAESFCETHKPSITSEKDFVAGRAKLPRKKLLYADVERTKLPFSFTRPSACLLERITCCVAQKEPVLLVGETGTGKTSSIQYLAKSTGNTLIVINMNQQSESVDLLGGYKPVDLKFLIKPIREEFEILFRSFFAVGPNQKYLDGLAQCYKEQRWDLLLKLMTRSTISAVNRLKKNLQEKKGKDVNTKKSELLYKWERLLLKLEKLSSQAKAGLSLGFAFVEGSLVKAIKKGYWVLLDEINLANAETLECLSGLLEGSSGSLSLIERGDEDSIKRHPDFTLFACMNPATDVGKKELPVGLRNRFTEFYVDELTSKIDLQLLVDSYLRELNLTTSKHEAIVKFYLSLHKEANKLLNDGTMNKPHYSLRTLCRALSIAAYSPCGNSLRSLYEAFCLSFLTQLDHKSYPIVQDMIIKNILDKNSANAIIRAPIPKPNCNQGQEYINFEGYWVTEGTVVPEIPKNYILTPSVKRNLKDIVRAVSIGKMPILLQGDTSVGKTSLITYLAKASGHVCVRINNHEHTDLQEYVGSYVADETGKLIFREGILVEAMRKGYWIILDELNLAPSDVLEALNRVLDDNRELFIPETQQVVKAHNNFMLFATQNPPGLYGGRKVLSRAFRNRFVELHFDEIPPEELETILAERCSMPKSYCKQIIGVMKDLQIRRKTTAAFAGKKGFITLRDLFRWGERYRLAPDVGQNLYDWSQHLADEGYLVLAAKVRLSEEEAEIREVINKHLRRIVKPEDLFTLTKTTSSVTKHILEQIHNEDISNFKHIVWTYDLRRMAVLLIKSCQFKEPVLLVGETGCGKTTVCQLVAAMQKQKLHVVNCHMHTESSDFLGNLRPVRNQTDEDNQKFFEWVDGPLIHAMKDGDLFLADEISLADDSVLERLNSLLEPERTLVLTEKGIDLSNPNKTDSIIVANERLFFVGTMNPGGDYGKKELSPALRNRFTEIWCHPCTEREDLKIIIEHNLDKNLSEKKSSIALGILNFVDWIATSQLFKNFIVSTRDILSWVNFINIATTGKQLALEDAILQGACLTYTDGLGSNTTTGGSSSQLDIFKHNAFEFLSHQLKNLLGVCPRIENLSAIADLKVHTEGFFGIEPFFIEKGPDYSENREKFTFIAPTTKLNTLKLLRAMQIKKPILLEGSPGVGKTSLVSAVAKASGHSLFRINLSDQTDVCDLFGTDLPVEGGKGGEFSWRDGPFLRALRAGHWILLDELNLASQAVLESLNACFDHRGELFIPELGKTFFVKPGTKFFACQNPMRQGGARRGLPKSFLNRFTQVYVSTLTEKDLKVISTSQFPEMPQDLVHKMVEFNSRMSTEAGILWGLNGSPWEMNLRDVIRWCEATIFSAESDSDEKDMFYNPGSSMELIYVDRMRTETDKDKVREIYRELFPVDKYPLPAHQPIMHVTNDKLYFGDTILDRNKSSAYEEGMLLLRDQMKTLKSLAQCINMNWMSILVGGPGSGKSSVVRVISQLAGQKLKTVVVNSAMDTNEILGGFEQTDYNRHLEQLFEHTENLVIDVLKTKLSKENIEEIRVYHSFLEDVRNIVFGDYESLTSGMETALFLQKLESLSGLISNTKKLGFHLEELDQIADKLKSLSSIVKQETCLNAGGKFEWVDSLLVKCLQDGSWLLIDQVNFCSPALLDRLNGLLEPNGVLTIGERGTGIDGNIMTIKPHKNFRLFLTMDPRYGEISRAMRNRGIEIYLLDSPKTCVELDVRSMLFNSGLVNKKHQDTLLEIHEKISQDESTTETFNVIQLLQSAFLISEQISRGFPLIPSFETSCEDVYLKSRAISQQQTKERLVSLIRESLNQLKDSTDSEERSVDLSTITWKIADYLENSKLAVIKQEGVLLNYFIKSRSLDNAKLTLEILMKFFNLDHFEDVESAIVYNMLSFLLLEFYERSSKNDVHLRHQWLVTKMNIEGIQMVNVCEKLREEVSNFELENLNEELPWDMSQLPRTVTREVKEKYAYDANRLALLLYWIMIHQEDLEKESLSGLSLKRYSTAVLNGTLTPLVKDEPLITNFTAFTSQVGQCIDSLLREEYLTLKATDYVKLRRNLKWYKRYSELGNLLLKIENSESSSNNLRQISLLLKVHYKWIVKFMKIFVGMFSELSEHSKMKIGRLFQMIDDINQSLFSQYDPVVKVAKKFKASTCLPLPHPSELIASSFSILAKVTRYLKPWKSLGQHEDFEKNLVALLSTEGLKARRHVLSLWYTFFTTNSFEEVDQDLLKIQEFCEVNHLDLVHEDPMKEVLNPLQSFNQTELAGLSTNLQLWPLYEYMFHLLTSNVQQVAFKKVYEDSEDFNVTTQLWQKWAEIPSIPVDVLSISNAILVIKEDPEKICRLVPALTYLLAKIIRSSSAINDYKRISHWEGMSKEDLETSTSIVNLQKMEKSNYKPGFLNLILELLLNKSKDKKNSSTLAMPSLGTHEARISQLKKLKTLLWRNSISLNSEKFDCLLNDQKILFTCSNQFISLSEKLNLESELDNLIKAERNPLTELKEILKDLHSSSESDLNLLQRGKAWTLFGYLRTFLFTSLGYIDPLYKVDQKLRYAEEDIRDFKSTVYVGILQSRLLGDAESLTTLHPRFTEIEKTIKQITIEKDDLKSKKAFRPTDSEFLDLSKDFKNLRNTLSSYEVVGSHICALKTTADNFYQNMKPDIKRAERIVCQAETWQESLEQFMDRVENRFLPSYPDLVLPALAALSDMKRGISMMVNELEKLISIARTSYQDSTVEGLIEKLVSYPTIGPKQLNLLELANNCTSKSTRELINKNLKIDNVLDSCKEQFKITLSGLHELHNHILLNGSLSKPLWHKLSDLMHQIILIWKKQQQEVLKRQVEEDSMYKNKAQIFGDQLKEEEEVNQELQALFPTHGIQDFSDLQTDSEFHMETEETKITAKVRECFYVSSEEIQMVHRLYSNILRSCTTSDWLKPPPPQVENLDYIEPLVMRYNTVGFLLENATASLSPETSQHLYPSLNMLTEITRCMSQGEEIGVKRQTTFDFYKDSNVSEVSSCLQLLRNIFDRVSIFLNEWPDHPTLKCINVVIERILHFPITSSLSRFLIGLELLLIKMKEWEENAHKQVSLFDQMNLLTEQIFSWRKLELSFWKDCLNVASQRFRSQSAKWCFWLYILLESYINKTSIQEEPDYLNLENKPDFLKEDELTPHKLAETLHFFISKSPLGEFEARLELLLTFHCHAFFFDPCSERDEILAVTWNVYNYYKQFMNEVNTKISSIRVPIERKLKDFVKITRWNDISYWAVKETIAKTHRTLFKFIKEFEKGLRENVASCLFVKPTTSSLMSDKAANRDEKNVIDSDIFIVSDETAKKLEIRYPKQKIILKASDLRQIMTQLKNKISSSQYLELRMQLEEFINEYMERSADLKKIEIDASLPKPKQISHAKSVLQQKKKALSDYFKLIAHAGVSYRIGILAWKNNENTVIDLMVPPLDLDVALRNFYSAADKWMLSQWKGCENYYNKATAEFIALNQHLSKAHEDLGPLNVERFKGYSAHMMLMANEQKKTLTKKVKHFIALRSQVSSLAEINGEENMKLPKQCELLLMAKILKRLLLILQPSLEQLQLYLRACPATSDMDENEVYDLEPSTLAILNATKEDSAWEKVNSLIKDCSLSTRVISDQFDSVFQNVDNALENEDNYVDCIQVFTSKHFNYLRKSYKGLQDMNSTLIEIGTTFGATEGLNHPIIQSIQFIAKEISASIQDFDELQIKVSSEEEMQISSSNKVSDFDKMLTDVLRVAVRVIRSKNKVNVGIKNSDEESVQLKKNSLSEMLIKSLKTNIEDLNLDDVAEMFNTLLLNIYKLDAVSANLHFKAIAKCLPLLEQYLLYVQFYLNEQVAALRLTSKMLHLQLNVFLDLAMNGFCIPKNLDLDADADGEEGSQQNSNNGGMGLSNEEGVKDVSDRIESEDQLEEAQPKDQEKNDSEDKDCAEEENGINMSEDFEGKMQDIEKGENESEKGDDDDGDLDKEMGETEEGAEQQDEQIWGDDEDEEAEDNDAKEDGKSGRGEELDDKTMGAKENEEGLPEESKETGDIEEKEEISEMNEPDINDDQIDPYHGKQQPEVEPEALDLPDDMNLDDGEGGEDQGQQDEDAFDIDNMKEPTLPAEDETEKDGANEDENKEDAENKEGDEDGSNVDSEDESPSDKNAEAVPIQTESGKNEEPEAITEENEEGDQQTVPDLEDTKRSRDNAMQVDVGTEGTQDEVISGLEKDKNLSQKENVQESQNDSGTGRSDQGMGNTEASLQDGAQTDQKNTEANQKKKRKSPKETENRNTTLMDEHEPHVKKTKTSIQERQDGKEDMDADNDNQLDEEEANQDMEYRHVDNKESFNRYAIDAATEDQVKEQATKISMDVDTEDTEEPIDVNMLHEDEVIEEESLPQDQIQKPEQVSNSEDKSKGKSSKSTNETGPMEVDSDIQTVDTTKIERGIDSAFYTNISNLLSDSVFNSTRVEEKRNEVKQALQQWTSEPSTEEAIAAWNDVSTITDSSARELAEKLRLVLEPTQASRLKGDYRTGKRINMRKIIPYIASQFRKDKIWLRRTKPSKRNYQIVLAIDDSSSMIDNDSKEIAFESLSLISKAMMYLEAGQLGVISFGESINILHPLEEVFTQESGARLMKKLRFEQKKTMVGQLINYSMDAFNGQNDAVENAKLLVILSDGRGVFSEGAEKVNHAIRRARLAGVFIVFIIIDNPSNKESILDIRQPVFQNGKLQGVFSYMERFPFPFYMILRDINALPDILSDALRQWFELIGNMDS